MSYSIKAESLSKRYDLARASAQQKTLVETFDGWLHPWRRTAPGASGDFWALRDVDFEIEQGDAVGVIGSNGAGKSTLLKILSRVTDPTAGSVRLRGRVASLLEVGTGFHFELTGRENVFLNGAILGMKRAEVARRFDQIVDYAGVGQFIDMPVKRYSSGMYLRLAFAVASFLESEILIVDEVLAVGDLAFQEKCLGTMRDASNSGRTVLFVSHNMSAVGRLTRRCLLLDAGRIAFDGDSADATRKYVGLKKARTGLGRQPADQIVCTRRLRSGSRFVIAEMGLAEGQPQDIAVGGKLRLEILIEANSDYSGLRIAYSINSGTGDCVLTGLTPDFSVRSGRQLLELEMRDLDLVPGDYNLSINLGRGQLPDPKGEADSFMGFGYFQVLDEMTDGRHFRAWNSQWAAVLHRQARLSERPLADADPAAAVTGT